MDQQTLLGYILVNISVVPSVVHSLILEMDFLEIFRIELNLNSFVYNIMIFRLYFTSEKWPAKVFDCFSSIAPEDRPNSTYHSL